MTKYLFHLQLLPWNVWRLFMHLDWPVNLASPLLSFEGDLYAKLLAVRKSHLLLLVTW